MDHTKLKQELAKRAEVLLAKRGGLSESKKPTARKIIKEDITPVNPHLSQYSDEELHDELVRKVTASRNEYHASGYAHMSRSEKGNFLRDRHEETKAKHAAKPANKHDWELEHFTIAEIETELMLRTDKAYAETNPPTPDHHEIARNEKSAAERADRSAKVQAGSDEYEMDRLERNLPPFSSLSKSEQAAELKKHQEYLMKHLYS